METRGTPGKIAGLIFVTQVAAKSFNCHASAPRWIVARRSISLALRGRGPTRLAKLGFNFDINANDQQKKKPREKFAISFMPGCIVNFALVLSFKGKCAQLRLVLAPDCTHYRNRNKVLNSSERKHLFWFFPLQVRSIALCWIALETMLRWFQMHLRHNFNLQFVPLSLFPTQFNFTYSQFVSFILALRSSSNSKWSCSQTQIWQRSSLSNYCNTVRLILIVKVILIVILVENSHIICVILCRCLF